MRDLTVIIPTYNESETIINTIAKIQDAIPSTLSYQILIVDDNSPDGTASLVRNLNAYNVDVMVRVYDHGLSQSVVSGFHFACSDVIVVTDADLSHDVSVIPEMYNKIKAGYDIVIGSRYMEGGGIYGWPLKRRVISLGATCIAKCFYPKLTDPVSGFFAVKKSLVTTAPLKPSGYKILLEVLSKCPGASIIELPYIFTDRTIGESKLNTKIIYEYVKQIMGIIKS